MEQETGRVQQGLRRGGSLIVDVTFDNVQSLDGLDVGSKRRNVFENVQLFLLNVINENRSLRQIEIRIGLLSDEVAPTHAVGSPRLNPDSPPDVFLQGLTEEQASHAGDFHIEARIELETEQNVHSKDGGFALVIQITRTKK